jgi:hypothetical protein
MEILRVYHFANREHGLDDIRQRRLKIATINDLNDPFELLGPSGLETQVRRRFQQLKTQLAAKRGMLCFSRNWKNPVQWSHYADKHRGICLGRLPLSVSVIDAGPADPGAAKAMIKVLSTKYSHWRYEQEMRCFITLNNKEETGLYFFSFSGKMSLKEVIVGACSTITRVELNDALGDLGTNVDRRKARLAFGSFTVIEERNAKLWE